MTRIYLAGPIFGASDEQAHGWREELIGSNPDVVFVNPMVRDYRGREDENVNSIVEDDKADITGVDYVIAWAADPSWGTAMEIFFAWSQGIPVIAIVPVGQRVSPWLRYHTRRVVPSPFGAMSVIRGAEVAR